MNKTKTRCLILSMLVVGLLVIAPGDALGGGGCAPTGTGISVTCDASVDQGESEATYICDFRVVNGSGCDVTLNSVTVNGVAVDCSQGGVAVTTLGASGTTTNECIGPLIEGTIPFSCSGVAQTLNFVVDVVATDAEGNGAGGGAETSLLVNAINCNDADACTADSCVQGPGDGKAPGGCVNTPGLCQDGCALLVIDEDSIDNGNLPNDFSDVDVNDQIAKIGLRAQLPVFSTLAAADPLLPINLWTGSMGDEGWFALTSIPPSWASSGLPADGLLNYWLGGPGVGSGKNPEKRLDKIPGVTPLRATGLSMLEGSCVCAIVYDSDISINYDDPINGSLKGANLGKVAFQVNSVTQLFGQSSGSLPEVNVTPLNADTACDSLELFTDAPVPTSSSEPFDVVPPAPD